MAQNINLKELEKKAWRSTFEDGLFDIYLGILFFGIGTGSAFGLIFGQWYNYLFIFLIMGVSIIILTLGKNYITVPRVGFVKFGKQRKIRKAKIMLVLIINIIFLLAIWYLLTTPQGGLKYELPFNAFSGLFIGLLMMIPLWAVAYLLQFNRLFYHAILIGLTPFATDLLELFMNNILSIILAYAIMDGIIVITGVVFLFRFLKKYPLPKGEVE